MAGESESEGQFSVHTAFVMLFPTFFVDCRVLELFVT